MNIAYTPSFAAVVAMNNALMGAFSEDQDGVMVARIKLPLRHQLELVNSKEGLKNQLASLGIDAFHVDTSETSEIVIEAGSVLTEYIAA